MSSYDVLEGGTEDDILGVASDGSFVLSPEEGPVVVVLKVVWAAEEKSGCHIAGDEGEVCTIVTIEHLFGASCTDHCHEGIVVVRVASVESVGGAKDCLFLDDVREVEMSKADSRAEAEHLIATSPVTQSNRQSIGVLSGERVQINGVLLHVRT